MIKKISLLTVITLSKCLELGNQKRKEEKKSIRKDGLQQQEQTNGSICLQLFYPQLSFYVALINNLHPT